MAEATSASRAIVAGMSESSRTMTWWSAASYSVPVSSSPDLGLWVTLPIGLHVRRFDDATVQVALDAALGYSLRHRRDTERVGRGDVDDRCRLRCPGRLTDAADSQRECRIRRRRLDRDVGH